MSNDDTVAEDGYDEAEPREPIAWAIQRPADELPWVPYPGSGVPGSREVVDRQIAANPGLGWRAVPLVEGTSR